MFAYGNATSFGERGRSFEDRYGAIEVRFRWESRSENSTGSASLAALFP